MDNRGQTPIIVFNPTGSRKQRDERDLARRLERIDGSVISFIDSGQVEAKLLEHLQQLVEERYKPKLTLYWNKPSRSHPTPPALIEQIIARSDAVILGVAA